MNTTPAESARLTKLILDLRAKGYTQTSIAKAVGLAQSAISKRLVNAGHRSTRNQYTDLPGLPPLGVIEWRDKPPEDVVADYHLSLPARAISNDLRHLNQINAVVRLAYDVTDALEVGDTTWVNACRADLNDMADYLRRLIAVVDDEDLRKRARVDHHERDDIRPTPRLVAS